MKRIAVYLRVSTQDQSTQLQRSEIETYLAARGWADVKFFEDRATGTNSNRPMLRALLNAARAREIDCVVVWKLDRFARSLKDLVTMIQELGEIGVEFISLKDQLDLSTSAGKLMLNIIGAFAQFEADIIKERVRAGIANAKAKGKRLGRPRTVNRYRVESMSDSGYSVSRIAREMCVGKGTVSKILKDRLRQRAEVTQSEGT
jgi:putative DNA-invertase from lambdoid prophage Rac